VSGVAEQVRSLSRQFREIAQQSAHSWPADADQTATVAGSASPLFDPAAAALGGAADPQEEQLQSQWDSADLEEADEEQPHSGRHRQHH